MDEQPSMKEMKNVIDYCKGRRKQLALVVTPVSATSYVEH
jgi:hypothetical protein